jgi:hypothetical protein
MELVCNPEKLSWVRFPAKMVPVARKISTIEERRQDQSCLFRRGDHRNKGHNTEKLLGSSPGEFGFCSSGTKHDRRTAPRQNLSVSARRLQGRRLQVRKLPWVQVSVKMFGLGNNNNNFSVIFNDTYRTIRPIIYKLSGNKD